MLPKPFAIGFTLLLTLLAGCTTVPTDGDARRYAANPQARDCAQWFKQLDQSVDAQGVRDAGASRVPDYPHLRVDRFLASFQAEVQDEARMQAWLARLATLDEEARRHEALNLPAAALKALGVSSADEANRKSKACRSALIAIDTRDPATKQSLPRAARVSDDYQPWLRVAGLYTLTSAPFFEGVQRWEASMLRHFDDTKQKPAPASLLRYQPESRQADKLRARQVLKAMRRDALGVPIIDATALNLLLTANAPSFDIESVGDFDWPGALQWPSPDAATPMVDPRRPTVYARHAFTRWGGKVHLQLIYTVWFSKRPSTGTLDLLAGALDGVTLRITLGQDGTPVMFDTIHPCGCYHMFMPVEGIVAKAAPKPYMEWAFVPQTVAKRDADADIAVRITSASHDVVGITQARSGKPETIKRYTLVDDDTLRALRKPEGDYRSVFDASGIVAGTERAERYLFWPMGIASAGAMRQWGRHATAFVGRRHFDDADLLELRFTPPSP